MLRAHVSAGDAVPAELLRRRLELDARDRDVARAARPEGRRGRQEKFEAAVRFFAIG
jgi:hypothetical protein